MKPPPRKRTKPHPGLKFDSEPQRISKWQRFEKTRLLNALRKLGKDGVSKELDFSYLKKCLVTRSSSEVHAAVESLKNKVIAVASLELKRKRWGERNGRKPIEMWTSLASAVAGTLEESISTAFSQMLIVSSTEPRTLRNCNPPQTQRAPTDKAVGRTVPLKPLPCLPVQVARDPKRRIPPPQQQLCSSAQASPTTLSTSQSAVSHCQLVPEKAPVAPSKPPPPATQASSCVAANGVKAQSTYDCAVKQTEKPPEQHPSSVIIAASTSTSPSPNSVPSCSASTTAITTTTPSSATSISSYSSPSHSNIAAAVQAKGGPTGKQATQDAMCIVDFERIYRYLCAIHKPTKECHLTLMESAIVLDLLMCLPEELPHLNCKKLQEHMIQVYQCLTSPADTSNPRELFESLKNVLAGEAAAAPNSQKSRKTNSQQNTPGAAGDVTDSRGEKMLPDGAENQSSANQNTSSQSVDADANEVCPPLNPFLVPLKLLMRK